MKLSVTEDFSHEFYVTILKDILKHFVVNLENAI